MALGGGRKVAELLLFDLGHLVEENPLLGRVGHALKAALIERTQVRESALRPIQPIKHGHRFGVVGLHLEDCLELPNRFLGFPEPFASNGGDSPLQIQPLGARNGRVVQPVAEERDEI